MVSNEPSPDVPLFLRKTYHMIDTCDPEIACWSDDGETFVVKDPVKFEQTIIPQFFKHSKFSSFVRQLNFYSFRKIKYHDTLRIDPKLEAETANYWRFKHESFQRGKAHLLSKIKRMQGTSSTASAAAGKGGVGSSSSATTGAGADSKAGYATAAAPQPDAVLSSTVTAEVQTLKKRIEEMTKNIDELTAMVKEVSLKQEESTTASGSSSSQSPPQEYYVASLDGAASAAGVKRKKWSHAAAPTIGVWADDDDAVVRPDEMVSSMDLDDIVTLPAASMPIPDALVRESSTASSTQISDMEFVDTLFTAFKDEQGDEVFVLEDGTDDLGPQQQQLPSCAAAANDETKESELLHKNNSRPDDELMRRLSDALMLLPKEMQEMIVNRLIAAITSADFAPAAAVEGKSVAGNNNNNKVEIEGCCEAPSLPQTVEEDHQAAPFPLAAATLAALLRHYTAQLQQQQHGKSPAAVNKSGTVEKSIPVIPVHA